MFYDYDLHNSELYSLLLSKNLEMYIKIIFGHKTHDAQKIWLRHMFVYFSTELVRSKKTLCGEQVLNQTETDFTLPLSLNEENKKWDKNINDAQVWRSHDVWQHCCGPLSEENAVSWSFRQFGKFQSITSTLSSCGMLQEARLLPDKKGTLLRRSIKQVSVTYL